jgi:hypothetical protein
MQHPACPRHSAARWTIVSISATEEVWSGHARWVQVVQPPPPASHCTWPTQSPAAANQRSYHPCNYVMPAPAHGPGGRVAHKEDASCRSCINALHSLTPHAGEVMPRPHHTNGLDSMGRGSATWRLCPARCVTPCPRPGSFPTGYCIGAFPCHQQQKCNFPHFKHHGHITRQTWAQLAPQKKQRRSLHNKFCRSLAHVIC